MTVDLAMTDDYDLRANHREMELLSQQHARRQHDAMTMLISALEVAADRFTDSAAMLEKDGEFMGETRTTSSFLRASAERCRIEAEMAGRLWRGEIK